MPGMGRAFRVTFVCTGNICRSPIGEVVLRDRLVAEGLADRVEVWSAGTGDWHVGEPADHRARATLREHGHDGERHRARQFRPRDFEDADLVLALDRSHLRTLTALARSAADREKVRLLRTFDPVAAAGGLLDVADPYFGGRADFEETYRVVAAANAGLVAHLRRVLSTLAEP
jgi:protein-tyrosine phosphatase